MLHLLVQLKTHIGQRMHVSHLGIYDLFIHIQILSVRHQLLLQLQLMIKHTFALAHFWDSVPIKLWK